MCRHLLPILNINIRDVHCWTQGTAPIASQRMVVRIDPVVTVRERFPCMRWPQYKGQGRNK